MTLQEFKNKYLGKQVEYHSFGTGAFNQCVDLVNQYIHDCLDTTTKDYTEIIGTNAKDFGTKYDKEDFDLILNTPTGVPKPGDIVYWNGNVGGGVGHVAIFMDGDVNTFRSLDQNWSQKERVTIETHNYTNVLGWLRPKVAPVVTPPTPNLQAQLDQMRKKRDDNYNLYITCLADKRTSEIALQGQINTLKNRLDRIKTIANE